MVEVEVVRPVVVPVDKVVRPVVVPVDKVARPVVVLVDRVVRLVVEPLDKVVPVEVLVVKVGEWPPRGWCSAIEPEPKPVCCRTTFAKNNQIGAF